MVLACTSSNAPRYLLDLEMSDIRRNLRPFGRVGLRVVEYKKALETLLKDDTICEKKLIEYCSFHPLPLMYRILIWKILLHILPVHQQSHKFVMQQRKEQYDDLYHALTVVRKIDKKSTMQQIYLKAYLLETGQIGVAFYHEKWHELFLALASSVTRITDDAVDGYWLSVRIFQKISRYFEKDDEREVELYNTFTSVLSKECPKLYQHLTDVQAINCLPYKKWFLRCYSGTLEPEGGLERVWDVMLSGSFAVLAYVAVNIVVYLERKLLQLQNIGAIQDVMSEPYSEDVGEVIACKGVDLWLRYKEHNQA